jgi:RNA polymerase sigma factor (sigma-70 family)
MKCGETARIHRWLERLQEGDQNALNELIVHFERRLRSLAHRMIRDYPLVHRCEQTDDIFQRAVLRLCRALKAASPGSTRDLIRLSAVQVRRELLNLARFYRSRRYLLGTGDTPDTGGSGSVSSRLIAGNGVTWGCETTDHPSDLDQWTEFHKVAASLPEPENEVFDLVWYQGMTQEEVARVQCVSVRTVKKRWNSARMAIYDALDGRLPGI